MPYPLRVAGASAHGYYLRWWRYGSSAERLVEEALACETWPAPRWKQWQEERLAYLLHRAATQVPYYRQLWERRRRSGDRASWEVLGNWPLLKKEAIRKHPRAFLAEACNPRWMYHLHTSGTTGKPLQLWRSRETLRRWYALYEARLRRWNGVRRQQRWAMIGGQLVAPFNKTRPPFWVWNAGMNQLYLSSYHLAPAFIPAYLEALRTHHITHMIGYASSLYALAQIALDQKLSPPSLQVILSNAEPLYDHQRRAIGEAFTCPIRDTYGMTELVTDATECAAGSLHLWPEVGVTEVWDDEHPERAPHGRIGRLICTGLLNADMPLVRYEVGDRGALAPPQDGCACGRTLPILQSVEGRLDDVILTRDGRRVGRLDPVFKADLPIREAQIIQETLGLLRVRIVPGSRYSQHHEDTLRTRLHERVGDLEIVFEKAQHLPRTANGKVRSVISKVALESNGQTKT